MDNTKAITEYNPIEVALSQLEDQYGGTVWVCDTPERLKAAKSSHREIRKWRIALEKERKRLKADVLKRGRKIDGEAERIAARIAAVEDPCLEAIKAEEDKKKMEKEAAERAERERVERCRAEIDRIRSIPVQLTASSSDQIEASADDLQLLVIRWPDEFAGIGEATRNETLATLRTMRDAALSREEESARLAEERAELELLRAEKDARDAEERAQREAEERARREKIEREERERRERIAAEERAAREARDKADAEARALRAKQDEEARRVREAEEQRQREERERLDAERRALEEAEREQRLKDAEQQDARSMLSTFIELYSWMPEFGPIVDAIQEYFGSIEKL